MFASANVAGISRNPFPQSEKVYVVGSDPSIRVPMREVRQSATRHNVGKGEIREAANPPITLYDTSGPFTDPAINLDLSKGLPAIRQGWIVGRGDVKEQ